MTCFIYTYIIVFPKLSSYSRNFKQVNKPLSDLFDPSGSHVAGKLSLQHKKHPRHTWLKNTMTRALII